MAADEVIRRLRPWLIVVTLCLFTCSVYYFSLAPTITWQHQGADSGDLATAVAVGGVPHPSGYPTYLLLAELFSTLPLGGDVAYRLNLMSAVCAALAVALLYLAAVQTLSRPIREKFQPVGGEGREESVPLDLAEVSALVAALTFAFSPLFWSQAVIAEVYALNAFFVALLVWLALQVRAGSGSCLGWLCPAMGLALGNHLAVILVLPLILALVWPAYRQQSRGRRLGLILLLLAGLSVYGIIPWRAASQPPVNWGGADHWQGLSWLVTGEPYHAYVFSLPWEYAGARLLALVQILVQALAWWGLPVAFWGWRRMLRHDRILAAGSLLTVGLIGMYTVSYSTADSYLYLLPALMLMSLWLAWGVLDLLRRVRAHPLRIRVAWALLVLPVVSMALNFSVVSLHGDRTALDFAEKALDRAAPSALILVDDDRHTFALWYARYALGQRPDVAIVNVRLLHYDWYQASLAKAHPDLERASRLESLIQRNIGRHPVYALGDTLNLPAQFAIRAVADVPQLQQVGEATKEP
jgi:hypothetical protein